MLTSQREAISPAQTLAPAARNAAATGSAVDIANFGKATALVSFGAWTDGTHTPVLQHSDTTTSGDFVDVPAAERDGSFTAVSSSAGQNAIQRVGYMGAKRYLRVNIGVSGATTGALDAAMIVRGEPRVLPK